MTKKAILLTIQKIHADKIFDRKRPKTKEYRLRPPNILKPTRTIMYVSKESNAPKAKKIGEIYGEFMMDPVNGARGPQGYPLPVVNPVRYSQPIPWGSVKRMIAKIKPPQQSFRYLKPENAEDMQLLEMLDRHRYI